MRGLSCREQNDWTGSDDGERERVADTVGGPACDWIQLTAMLGVS